MDARITAALAGNPNSGKTTMFNALTGSRQRVGNFPGVTVERKEGLVEHGGGRIRVVDLPGAYSLTAYSEEELVARNFLVEERPQVVVDVLDATSLERHLYLAVQLMELGMPVVLALNMMDEVRRKGRRIDAGLLSRLLGAPVVETVARSGQGRQQLLDEAAAVAEAARPEPLHISYGPDLDQALREMTALIEDAGHLTDSYPARWVAIKYLEQDREVLARGRAAGPAAGVLEEAAAKAAAHCRATLDMDPEALLADHRYGFIASLLRQGVVEEDGRARRLAWSDRIDAFLTHRFLGPLVMLGVLYALYSVTFTVGEIPMGWLEALFGRLSEIAEAALPDGLLRSLIVSGVIDGVGGVMGFVPLIAMMFVMISILEDSGYMARMAYMLDRVFRVFGLHGNSVMPFIVSGGIAGGCAVPGVMAARTLRSPKEKLATLLTAPFMNCGAKIPVFILLAGAFFPQSMAEAMFWITVGAWSAALLVARLLRSTVLRGESTPFVMELPPYRAPTFRGVLIHSWERVWQYIRKAGTVILAIAIVLWAAMTFPGLPEERAAEFQARRAAVEARLEQAPEDGRAALEAALAGIDNQEAEAALRHSLAGRVGEALEPVTRWAGFDWRTNIALVGGFAAKEVVVSTLGTAYSLGEVDPEETGGLSERLAKDPAWSRATGVSLLLFTMLYAPCFVTVVAIGREAGWKWGAFSMTFNTVLALAVSSAAYQLLSLA